MTLVTNQDLDPTALRTAFGMFPSGVVAVAAMVDDQPVGLAASSFTSVSLDPPLVSFSVARSSKTWPTLRRSRNLGVTVLSDQHSGVCRQLAGPVASRFDSLAHEELSGGGVVLTDGVAQFDCTIFNEVPAGDHVVVLLRLRAVAHSVGLPLVFHRSGFGTVSTPEVV